ncbi:MAG: hypothetical protein H6622_17235 [Halobacteriovoraceae bacterium]|nr:hypothetical protein [Halobacteriovoraceae bacterium]
MYEYEDDDYGFEDFDELEVGTGCTIEEKESPPLPKPLVDSEVKEISHNELFLDEELLKAEIEALKPIDRCVLTSINDLTDEEIVENGKIYFQGCMKSDLLFKELAKIIQKKNKKKYQINSLKTALHDLNDMNLIISHCGHRKIPNKKLKKFKTYYIQKDLADILRSFQ